MAVSFEEFSVPPGSELALPPLFGGNILESELETEVEFVDGGMSGDNLQDEEEEEETLQRQREMHKRKYLALSRRCKEIEQVNERVLNRLHQVEKITRKLKHERRFLMRILDSYGDDYRHGQLSISLEDEMDVLASGNTENKPPEDGNSSAQRRVSGSLPGMDYKTFENSSLTEATPVKKRKKNREEKEHGNKKATQPVIPAEPLLAQVKIEEEDYGCDGEELPIDWRQTSPRDAMLPYSKFSSPGSCADFD
ncbi:TCF3 fusion partner [Ambystoma mexicanum]|uniref:TCF3 fusion partner n=1 Tax=Ambystoma mexicanum TaxID=8296 RepID=UPI0037E8D961